MNFVWRNSRIFMGMFVLAMFLAGCVSMSHQVPPAEDVLRAGPLARILVFVGNVPLGGAGTSAVGTSINIGGTVYFGAQGRDMNNKPIAINPTWTASKPEVVEISPRVGSMVAVKGLREGSTEIVVEALGVKHTIEYISVK